MKKVILSIVLIAAIITAKAQSSISLLPSCPQTLNVDSVTIFAITTVSQGDLFAGCSWKQVAGPTIPIPTPSMSYGSGLSATSTLKFFKVPVGNYVFSATGTSKNGASSGPVSVSFSVIPGPVYPIRVGSSITITDTTFFSDGSYKIQIRQ